MENIEFENRFYFKDEMLKEYFTTIEMGIPKMFVILDYSLIVFSLVAGIYLHSKLLIILGFVWVGLIIISKLVAILSIRNFKKRSKTFHKNVEVETIYKFADKIYVEEGELKFNIDYSQIIKFKELKTCIVLLIGKSQGIILDPDGFSKGDLESFKKFILQKCENLSF